MNFNKLISTASFALQNPVKVSKYHLHFGIWMDYLNTKVHSKFIRKQTLRNADPDKIALFLSISDWIYEAKTEAMLALGLKMNGWRIVVLMSKRAIWARRYYELFGINNFIYFEDINLEEQIKKECKEEANQFLHRSLTFQLVKSWKYRGAWIGPQIIATVSRHLRKGKPDLNDELIKKNIISILPETLQTVKNAEVILAKLKPRLVLLNEANYSSAGPITDVAIKKRIDVIQFVQPHRDDALIFKRLNQQTRRFHPNSISSESMKLAKKINWTQNYEAELEEEFNCRYKGKWFLQSRNQPCVKQKSKQEIINTLKLDPSKKIAGIFSHVLWDANLFYGEDLFEDYGDWFVQTVKAACENKNINWIVKLHPANLWKRDREKASGELSELSLIKRHVGELPAHVKLLYPDTEISTKSLFESIDYGITVRGTVGVELPCFGVLTFTAGTGRYSGLGFTNDSRTKEEYLKKIKDIQKYIGMTKKQIELAKKHAYFLFRCRPWQMKSFKPIFKSIKKGTHPLDHNLLFKVNSFEEIRANQDLDKFAKWAETKEIDYLA